MMYGIEWPACYICGVKQRLEELLLGTLAQAKAWTCKDTARCARFAMEMQGIEERRGPVQPPPVPQTGAVKRRCEEPTTRRRACPAKNRTK